jgi:hypothetical protein
MPDLSMRELFALHAPDREPPLPPGYIASSLDQGRRRVTRRRVLTRGIAAVAALALAGGTVAVGIDSGPGADTTVGRGSGPGGAAAPPADAVVLLTRISLAASEQSVAPRDDQFIYTRFKVVLRGPGYTRLGTTDRYQTWVSVDGSRPGWSIAPNTKEGTVTFGGFPLPPVTGSLLEPTYRFLTTLPTDPDALLAKVRAYLLDPQTPAVTRGGTAEKRETVGKRDADQAVFDLLGGLINSSMLPPKLGAALYRAAARIPGVKLIPTTVDLAGRRATAVARTDNQGWFRSVWLFDPTTYEYRGERRFDLHYAKSHHESAVLERSVVDRLPPEA